MPGQSKSGLRRLPVLELGCVAWVPVNLKGTQAKGGFPVTEHSSVPQFHNPSPPAKEPSMTGFRLRVLLSCVFYTLGLISSCQQLEEQGLVS